MTPVPEELRVSVAYRFSDFYRAALHVFLRKPICWFVPSVIILIGVAVGVSLCLVWLLGIPCLETYRILRAPHMKQGLTYVFTDDGVAAEYTGVRNFADWSYVKGAHETRRDIFIKMPVGAHVIPKWQISAEQGESLRRIVRAHVAKAFV